MRSCCCLEAKALSLMNKAPRSVGGYHKSGMTPPRIERSLTKLQRLILPSHYFLWHGNTDYIIIMVLLLVLFAFESIASTGKQLPLSIVKQCLGTSNLFYYY